MVKKNIKVLHLTNNYPTANFPISGIFVKEQVESLKNTKIDTDVYLINGREKGKLEYLKQIFKLRKFLRHNEFDVIHCHHALTALTLLLSGYKKKSKVVVSFQNDPKFEYGIGLFKFIEKRTDAWIFKNNSNMIRSKHHYYLPNGVNTDLFRPIDKDCACERLNLDKDKTYVLFVSSNFMRTQKRYDLFCKVMDILKNKYGHVDLDEIKLINTSREEVPYYFNAASIHLLTSDFEGSPNSVKEAMACGTSVVSTDVGNVNDLLKEVQGSFVSESNDPEELAKLVDIALGEIDNNGREMLVQKSLDINSVAVKLENIYKDLLN